MKIGLTGLPGSGKSTVFSALTGIATGSAHRRRRDGAQIGTVKVPDPRVEALALIYRPRKTVYAEITFTDLVGGRGPGLDRGVLHAMRDVDALCHVLRAFAGAVSDAPDPVGELEALETEALLADLEVIEARAERVRKEGKKTPVLALLERVRDALEAETPLRRLDLDGLERKALSGYGLLTLKSLLVVHNVGEDEIGSPPPPLLLEEAAARGTGVITLSAQVERDIAQMEGGEQRAFVDSLGLGEPARDRFIRAAFALTNLVSMITVGPDECRAWPVRRGLPAPRAAGKIHSDIERGFIRAEVVPWQELVERGSEARCREAGLLRVEGKEYIVQDGDVINFRFNV